MTDQLLQAIVKAIPDLPAAWLRDRRWFSSKGRELQSLSVDDWGTLPLDRAAVLVLARARYNTGRDEVYLLPLVADQIEQPDGVAIPPAMTLQHNGETWHAHDAFHFPSFRRWLMEALIGGEEIGLDRGRVVFQPDGELQRSPPPLREIKLVTAEQSNSSIIYDKKAILKGFRRIVAGLNPDVEISRFLSEIGFSRTPTMLGSISYWRDDTEHSLGVLQSFVPNKGDAWEHMLNHLRSFVDAAKDHEHVAPDTIVARTRQLAANSLRDIRELGELSGQLHLALAADKSDPNFAPRPLDAQQVKQWQNAIRQQRDDIFRDLEQRSGDLPQEQREAVESLLAAGKRIEERVSTLDTLANANVVTTRYHGDYHLGQILVSERGFLVLDFEGEPLRSLEERRAHHSPLKDVAGMLRSLSYAAETAQRDVGNEQVAWWTREWEQQARQAYLDGYIDVTRGAPFVPRDNEAFNTAVAVFELEKALYELNYELNNRPDWLPIPLRGIQRVV